MENVEVLSTTNLLRTRPSEATIDQLASEYRALTKARALAEKAVEERQTLLVDLVNAWGIVPPNAEKSRRLSGRLAQLTVTKSDTLTINDDRVNDLKEALESTGRDDLFEKLFCIRSKWEIVEGAEAALKNVSLPKRLVEKVMNMWGRCISVKPKKPSLKVSVSASEKPAKKSKKAAQA